MEPALEQLCLPLTLPVQSRTFIHSFLSSGFMPVLMLKGTS